MYQRLSLARLEEHRGLRLVIIGQPLKTPGSGITDVSERIGAV
jgi:hypothetical protein